MTAVHQAIILAAGRGHQVDGMAKVLIRHPATGKSILEHAIEAFAGKRIVVVVGFRAIHVMESARSSTMSSIMTGRSPTTR